MVTALALAAICAILWTVRGLPAPGDIASALTSNPDVYTLSLGHMTDLTMSLVRISAGAAGGGGPGIRDRNVGCVAASRWNGGPGRDDGAVLPRGAAGAGGVRSLHVVAAAGGGAAGGTAGKLIVDDQYYTFSSVFFYTNRRAYLLNGRVNNLDYGSYAPDAPQDVFIDDADFQRLWNSDSRYYLVVEATQGRAIRATGGQGAVSRAEFQRRKISSHQSLRFIFPLLSTS